MCDGEKEAKIAVPSSHACLHTAIWKKTTWLRESREEKENPKLYNSLKLLDALLKHDFIFSPLY